MDLSLQSEGQIQNLKLFSRGTPLTLKIAAEICSGAQGKRAEVKGEAFFPFCPGPSLISAQGRGVATSLLLQLDGLHEAPPNRCHAHRMGTQWVLTAKTVKSAFWRDFLIEHIHKRLDLKS